MNKKKLIVISIAIISLAIIGLYQTFAMINNQVVKSNADYSFIIGNTTSKEIIVSSKTYKTLDINIENPYSGILKYGLAYTTNDDSIEISKLSNSQNNTSGTISKEEQKNVSLVINNPTGNDITINIKLIVGYINGGDLILNGNEKLITNTKSISNILNTNLDESGANKPNITSNMIPIYYDETNSSWNKADESNTNLDYQWYDYNNKKWANVVLINNNLLDYYQNLELGGQIKDEDILAYLVWIPRFKYQVWNINETINEDNYYYDAINSGINIIFESENKSTGVIECTQDKCTGNNGEYYTHPAFNFNGNQLSGFWVGKFETTGTTTDPTILPNQIALTNLDILEEYNTSKIFTSNSNYNLKDKDAHIIKSLEWGAISYLTNSVYGLCTEAQNSCRNIYRNNSSFYYTGSSAGQDSDNEPTNFGTYSYLGEKLDEYGLLTDEQNIKMVSSTTGNLYGVYDMVGGAYETVMLTNQKNSEYVKNIDSKYYDTYEDRIMLGDGISEITNEKILFDNGYLIRGGISSDVNSTLYSYNSYSGDKDIDVSFRITIS